MKRILILSILIFTVVFGISAEGNPTIAIMDVAATNTSDVKSQVIYEYIVDVINRANRYTIVERAALQEALKELEISYSGMVDDSTAAQIGKLVGAKFMLISNLIVDEGITYLSARIVSVETSQVSETAMLQMEEDEYIASLANRTISQLLGMSSEKSETGAESESGKEADDESVEKDETSGSEGAEEETVLSDSSGISITIGAMGILPFEKEGEEIFETGYGFKVDLDYKLKKMRTNGLILGIGTGLFFNSSTSDVLYPFDLISFPLMLNLKYRLVMGRLFITAKFGGGATYNMFTYTKDTPVDVDSTLSSLNAAVIPGLSAGYKLSDKIGLSLFADGSMTFYPNQPYITVNAGLAVDISL